MRRYFLTENNKAHWQSKQNVVSNTKKVVYILTKFDGEEIQYDDFWQAVMDAEDKYCTEANMISAYFEETDEDGLNSYELVPDGKPYDGHWTEEEGTITEPTQSYEDYVKTIGLNEAGLFPSAAADGMQTSWVARVPANNNKSSSGTPTVNQQTNNVAKPATKKLQAKPMTATERHSLEDAANHEDRVAYSLALLRIYMDRLAPMYGLNIYDASVSPFYDQGITSLCADVEDIEAWPTLKEFKDKFYQVVGRTMTPIEETFNDVLLRVLEGIAPDSYCEIFHNASAFYDMRASKWLDSECFYDDYEIAFELGWNGKPEEDWVDMMGSYNHAGEYLEMAYSFGADSRRWFKMICGI